MTKQWLSFCPRFLDVDVTTAVDIYSFGVCALEARLAPRDKKCPECSPEAVRWHVGRLFADGASGDPWERRVVLRFSGGHRQCHTVTGEPAAEGEMSRLYISAVFMSILIGRTALGFTCDSQRPFLVPRNVWPAFVFCRSSSRSASNASPANGPPPESCCSTRLCSKYRCWNSWPHIVLSAISVSLHASLVLNLSWQPS